MNNIHRIALAAAAFGAFAAAPSATAGEPVLPVKQYVNYAKLLNSADAKDTTNVVSSAVSEVVKAAGDSTQQAVGEISAALAAVSAFRSGTDSASSAALFSTTVAAASAAGSDAAESLGFAKIAAAAGSLVSGAAGFTSDATAGLPADVAGEVKAALENVDEALADIDPYAVKDVFEKALAALRGGSYKMREDDAGMGVGAAAAGASVSGADADPASAAAAIGVGKGVGLNDGGTVGSFGETAGEVNPFGEHVAGDGDIAKPTPTTLPGSGIFVGEITVPVEPVKKPKPKPTKPDQTPHVIH